MCNQPQGSSVSELMHSGCRDALFAFWTSFSVCASVRLEHLVPFFLMNLSLHTASSFLQPLASAPFHEFFIYTANRCSHLRRTQPGDG